MTLPIDDLAGKIGEPLGVSGWIEASQEHIVVEVDRAPRTPALHKRCTGSIAESDDQPSVPGSGRPRLRRSTSRSASGSSCLRSEARYASSMRSLRFPMCRPKPGAARG